MSMATLTECREKYAVDKGFRGRIYLIAFLVAVFNFGMMYLCSTVRTLGLLGLAVGFVALIGLYYISGVFLTFIAITYHIAVVVAHLTTTLAFFVPGIGIVLGWIAGLMVGCGVFGYGLGLLYFVPFIMMPLLGFLGGRFL